MTRLDRIESVIATTKENLGRIDQCILRWCAGERSPELSAEIAELRERLLLVEITLDALDAREVLH